MAYLSKTSAKGTDYYKLMESFREDGKVKHRVILNIGPWKKLSELLSKLIEHQNNSPPQGSTGSDKGSGSSDSSADVQPVVEKVHCRIHGAPFALHEIAEWIGVEEILNDVFPPQVRNGCSRGKALLLAAIQRACAPGSKAEFSDWFAETSLPEYLFLDASGFTSQAFWDQMDGIDVIKLQEAETRIVNRLFELFPDEAKDINLLALDYTNYYTFICSTNVHCDLAQRGHNKQKRDDLRQVSFAVITSPIFAIPIATLVYRGNKNDKSAFPEFMKLLEKKMSELGIKDPMYVFDGGSIGEENLKLIPGKFTSRASLSGLKDLYNVNLSEYTTILLDDDKGVKAYRTQMEYLGGTYSIIITLSEELKQGEVADMNHHLSSAMDEVVKINEMLANPKSTMDKKYSSVKARVDKLIDKKCHLNEFCMVDIKQKEIPDPEILKLFEKSQCRKRPPKSPDPRLKNIRSVDDIPRIMIAEKVIVSVNEDWKQAVIDKYFGKHALFTNRFDEETRQIIIDYRSQECVERLFRDSKDTESFSFQPIYHWTEGKVYVHFFICTLALTLGRVLHHMLEKSGTKISCRSMIRKLNRVQECHVLFANPDSKKPRSLLTSQKVIAEMQTDVKELWDTTQSVLKKYKEGGTVS